MGSRLQYWYLYMHEDFMCSWSINHYKWICSILKRKLRNKILSQEVKRKLRNKLIVIFYHILFLIILKWLYCIFNFCILIFDDLPPKAPMGGLYMYCHSIVLICTFPPIGSAVVGAGSIITNSSILCINYFFYCKVA